MKDYAAFPAMALVAHAEHLFEGRRVVVFGDATSPLPQLLLERGARLVHVYDANAARIAEASAKGSNKEISYAPLSQGAGNRDGGGNRDGAAARDGAFDFGIVLDIAAYEDGPKLITRLRRALAPRGIAIVAAPNPDAGAPLIEGPGFEGGPSYYDLYEWVSAEFDEVKMLGQLPICGYAVVDFGAEGEPDFALDTSYMAGGAEEPEWYLALASHFPVSIDAFTIVQVPRSALPDAASSEASERLDEAQRNVAQLEAELSRLRKAERLSQKVARDDERLSELEARLKERDAKGSELEARLKERDATISELEARLEEAQARIEEAEREATEAEALIRELKARVEAVREPEPAPASGPSENEELAWAEAKALEAQLEERGRELQVKDEQLRVADKMARELLSELESMKQERTTDPPELLELRERLRRAEESEARRVADLATAQWTIEQLRSRLAEVPPPSILPP